MSVMLVLSVLLAIVLPRIAPALERTKVNGAANVLASDLQYAQTLAVRHRRPMAVILQPASRQYIIRERDDATKVFRTRLMGSASDFSLDEFTATPASVYLYPNGIAVPDITFTLGLNGYRREVRMTRAGQIRIVRAP
jgi:type II secretory pathway pseudopilin PulG